MGLKHKAKLEELWFWDDLEIMQYNKKNEIRFRKIEGLDKYPIFI
jgi:hypothetical protein